MILKGENYVGVNNRKEIYINELNDNEWFNEIFFKHNSVTFIDITSLSIYAQNLDNKFEFNKDMNASPYSVDVKTKTKRLAFNIEKCRKKQKDFRFVMMENRMWTWLETR